MKCLIINDDKSSWSLLKRYISANLEIKKFLFAENGKIGIELAIEELPDFILLDLVMPIMDGFNTLNLLKEEPLTRNIPVVVITGQLKNEESRLKAISIGTDSFLNFPVKENELIDQIKRVLKERDRYFILNKYKRRLEGLGDEKKISDLSNESKSYVNQLRTNYSELIHIGEDLLKEVDDNQKLLEALRTEEVKFKILFDEARELIFLLKKSDSDYIIRDVNTTALNKLEAKKEELLNKSIFEFLEEENAPAIIEELLLDKNKNAFLTHKTSGGNIVEVEIHIHKIVISEEEIIYLTERDITIENKLLETIKKLSRVVEESPVSIIITDTSGNFEYINNYFTELTGYEFSDVKGKSTRMLKSGFHSPEIYTELWRIINGGDVWFGELKNKKKNGEFYWESLIISPIADKDGVITNFVSIGQDITEKKKLVDELKKAREEAEKANMLKSEFVAMISHEIRTPVNVMVNYANLLLEEFIDNSSELAMLSREGIQTAGNRLIKTVELLLNLSMIETGNVELDIKKNDLAEIIDEIKKEFQNQAADKGLKLSADILTENTISLCDKYSIVQILSNLLDNAIKFTEEGNVSIKLYQNKKGKKVISVEDTGIGIDKAELKNIFNPFWQAHRGYTRDFDGLGLGLSVVKKYCDANDLSISVISHKGKGSIFSIEFNN
jgi:PAS domain S-box-containing protein